MEIKKTSARVYLLIFSFLLATCFLATAEKSYAQQCLNCVEGVGCPEGYVFSSAYTCPNTNQICCVLQGEQATCASLGGTCRSVTLCDQGTNTMNSAATDCGSSEVCCVPSQTGTTCSGISGTCRASCESGETAQSGTYYDCVGNNTTCCTNSSSSSNNSNNSTNNSSSSECGVSGNTINFCNPLKFDTVEEVLTSLLHALQGVIVVISIIFIVIGAIFYITSGGNEERMKSGKRAIFAAMIGLAIGIAAPTFLKEIYTILGAENIPGEVSSAPSIATIALNTLNFLLSIVGALALIMLVVGGIMYLTAAGNEDQIDHGKKIVKFSIIGIAVALAALVIVKQIAAFFGG